MKTLTSVATLGLAALLCACPADSPTPAETGTTWHRDVRPIVEQRCLGCHAGGIGTGDLRDLATVEEIGESIVFRVESRTMPPWYHDDDCREVSDSRHLTDAEIEVFTQWKADGFKVGDEADFVAPAPSGTALGTPDFDFKVVEAYTPDGSIDDDYRCLFLDPAFAQESFIRAIDITPGEATMVHHVILFQIPAGAVEAAEEKDAQSPGPGYPCYGGTGVPSSIIAGWVPGAPPIVMPDGAAIQMSTGSRLMMQVHYNFDAVPNRDALPSDATSVQMWEYPQGATIDEVVQFILYDRREIDVPAGANDVEVDVDYGMIYDGRLIGGIPHMHVLGKSIDATLTVGSDTTNQCVSRVPNWAFDHQQGYMFTAESAVDLHYGDTLNVTCTFDNTAANQQPGPDGVKKEPVDVTWGEGSADEMCLYVAMVALPHYPGDGTPCSAFKDCYRDCTDPSPACLARCSRSAGPECSSCVTIGNAVCSIFNCVDERTALESCKADCPDTDFGCWATACRAEAETYHDCMRPHLLDGTCDEFFADCGMEFTP